MLNYVEQKTVYTLLFSYLNYKIITKDTEHKILDKKKNK